ncbi:methyltransferase domain-containing protein [Botrytis cinerea]
MASSPPAGSEPATEAPTPAPVPVTLEADDPEALIDDGDSALGSEPGSSTTSLASSITRYRIENGRTYHAYKDGKYAYPNDDMEQERLDLQHHICSLTFDGYSLGIDLSPIQPMFTPPNAIFQVDDLEEEWTFDDNEAFDFIHARMMTGSLGDWDRFFDQAWNNLKPGGYIELLDILLPVSCADDTLKPDSALLKWSQLLLEGSIIAGRDLNSALTCKEKLEKRGFQGVHQAIYKWPGNRWPKNAKAKEIGMWHQENLTSGLMGLSVAIFTRLLGWNVEELELFLVDVRREMKDTSIHAYWSIL